MNQEDLDRLWGGFVESFSLRWSDFTLVAQVVVVNGVHARYEVVIGGIREFHFKNDGPTQWSQVELTSIEVEPGGQLLDIR